VPSALQSLLRFLLASSRTLFSGWRTFYGKLPDHVTVIWPGQDAVSATGHYESGYAIKLIAERSGISEGMIYRHFESKDQLFFEAAAEPFKQVAMDRLAEAWREVEDR